MASMRNIKRRIKSVNSTQQITKAMNLVASSKLTKAKQNFDDTKPFFNAIRRVIANVVKGAGNTDNVFLKSREVKNTGVVILTGDRGLCGGYNTNACKTALGITEGKSASYITVGSKGFEFLKHKGCDFAQNYTGISEKPTYEDARDIGEKITQMYQNGDVDEVYLVYTEYISTIASEPKVMRLLPLESRGIKSVYPSQMDCVWMLKQNGGGICDHEVGTARWPTGFQWNPLRKCSGIQTSGQPKYTRGFWTRPFPKK